MLAGPSSELLNLVIVKEFLQVGGNLEIIRVSHRHRIETERILWLEIFIEVNYRSLEDFHG